MRSLSPLLAVLLCAFAQQTPQITSRPVVLAGNSPEIVVSGLEPGEQVRLHAVRRENGPWTQGPDGQWRRGEVNLDAWADFHADAEGGVVVDTARPIAAATARRTGWASCGPATSRGTPRYTACPTTGCSIRPG